MRPKPKLGQNFLVDDAAGQAIVDALGDLSARTVIEIGPGRGALTEILATRARRLLAIELDPALAADLNVRFRDHSHVEIHNGDILKADMKILLSQTESADLIGNLPYYITSEILLKLFASAPLLSRAVLMMQREVADRIAALPGRREYGLLSATTQLYASVATLFTLPPSAFAPPPEVYSTVLRLHFAPRFAELGVDAARFDAFLKRCFAQKRKTLQNNLRVAGYSIEQLAAAWPPGVPPLARSESLPLEAMATLYRALTPTS